jgi:S-adenosylmethionine synthetase
MGIFIDTYGTSKLNLTNGELLKSKAIFDMRPYFIEQRLKLRNPIYSETAALHMGRYRNRY